MFSTPITFLQENICIAKTRINIYALWEGLLKAISIISKYVLHVNGHNRLERSTCKTNKTYINALVYVNSQGHPSAGKPGDSDRVYLTHTGESDSLILSHSGDIWQNHFKPGEFWPQLERIVAYF